MSRAWIWVQLIIGWVPVWASYTLMIITMHGIAPRSAALIGLRAVLPAVALGYVVNMFTRRFTLPHPISVSFILLQLVAAATFALSWYVLGTLFESALHGRHALITPDELLVPFLILGVYLYVMVAGVSYATQATERAARAEASAARSQLAALRSSLHPHFLFNALHTVVQLIPREPARAAEAAEKLAGLLRTTVDNDREVVSLREEWDFVQRYLDIERIRFGERLGIVADIPPNALDVSIPTFSLQTLVENAVRHGAAPRVDPTVIRVSATREGERLTVRVDDNGAGAESAAATSGTGLSRLRERLAFLYGTRARLDIATKPSQGFSATLIVPVPADE